jgi:hypothetical protein
MAAEAVRLDGTSVVVQPTIRYRTQGGTLIFKRQGPSCFGSSYVVIVPPHGDLGCTCAPCRARQYAEQMRKRGYAPVEYVADGDATAGD